VANYGFVRDYANAHDFAAYQKAGLDTILLNADDPNLARDYAQARASGAGNIGIWIPSKNLDPESYARRAAQIASTYHPSVLVPDIEFEGKGGAGSAGWNWNSRAAALLRQLAPNQRLAVSTSYGVTPGPGEFNYQAWLNAGATGFLPQAYGAKLTDQFDPNAVRNSLIAAGVPASMISTILAPGQRPVAGTSYGAYALDDYNAQALQNLGYTIRPQGPQQAQAQAQPARSFLDVIHAALGGRTTPQAPAPAAPSPARTLLDVIRARH
jgi:hypothetical protein